MDLDIGGEYPAKTAETSRSEDGEGGGGLAPRRWPAALGEPPSLPKELLPRERRRPG